MPLDGNIYISHDIVNNNPEALISKIQIHKNGPEYEVRAFFATDSNYIRGTIFLSQGRYYDFQGINLSGTEYSIKLQTHDNKLFLFFIKELIRVSPELESSGVLQTLENNHLSLNNGYQQVSDLPIWDSYYNDTQRRGPTFNSRNTSAQAKIKKITVLHEREGLRFNIRVKCSSDAHYDALVALMNADNIIASEFHYAPNEHVFYTVDQADLESVRKFRLFVSNLKAFEPLLDDNAYTVLCNAINRGSRTSQPIIPVIVSVPSPYRAAGQHDTIEPLNIDFNRARNFRLRSSTGSLASITAAAPSTNPWIREGDLGNPSPSNRQLTPSSTVYRNERNPLIQELRIMRQASWSSSSTVWIGISATPSRYEELSGIIQESMEGYSLRINRTPALNIVEISAHSAQINHLVAALWQTATQIPDLIYILPEIAERLGIPTHPPAANSTALYRPSQAHAPTMPNAVNNASALEKINVDAPEHLCCSLSLQIMTDPVRFEGLNNQDCFEDAWIMKHLRQSNTHPITREPVNEKMLVSDLAVKQACDAFTQQHISKNKVTP